MCGFFPGRKLQNGCLGSVPMGRVSNLQSMTRTMCVVLALAATIPVILFYTASTEPTPNPVPLVFKIKPPTTSRDPRQPFQKPSAPQERFTIKMTEGQFVGHPQPEPAAMSTKPVSGDQSSTLTSFPHLTVIHEKAGKNGTTDTAQEITECTLVGQRGSEEDHADFYKIHATGETIMLQLDPSETRGLCISVLDEGGRIISKSTEQIDRVTVKPQETCYIKFDLGKVAVASQYKVQIRFENATQSAQSVNGLSKNVTSGEKTTDPAGL